MATYKAADLMTKPRHMGGYGNGTISWGSVTPTAAASGDVMYPTVIPAGTEVTGLSIINDQIDSSTGLSTKVGYMPVNAADGPVMVDDYFSATKTTLRTAGRTECAFQPIKFEKDVFVILTNTAAATTYVSGKVTVVVLGIAAGIK
jgi:hypothetical protein